MKTKEQIYVIAFVTKCVCVCGGGAMSAVRSCIWVLGVGESRRPRLLSSNNNTFSAELGVPLDRALCFRSLAEALVWNLKGVCQKELWGPLCWAASNFFFSVSAKQGCLALSPSSIFFFPPVCAYISFFRGCVTSKTPLSPENKTQAGL